MTPENYWNRLPAVRARGKISRLAAVTAALLALAEVVRAQEDDEGGLRIPERMTVGTSADDQFLGQLAPGEKRIYLVSNRSVAHEVVVLNAETGSMRRLFEEGAETTWPRVSPDGQRLLYVSFRDLASGQLCVRDLPDGGGRRCLEEGGALQAEWISPSRIALVGRASIQGDLHLLDVAVGETLAARPLLERNLASPAISPDGRWLVYVPVERTSERIGPGFAARASPRLEAVRLDRPGEKTWALALSLPGLSGQPAFSRDGRYLYVTQFFDDTNRDGIIDGADNGVLFRVTFSGEQEDAPDRAAASFPEQLTDGRRNCQYPAPAEKELVATCERRGSLDIYTLPLDGMVPPDWTPQRLAEEIDLASRPEDALLFYRQMLGRETDPQRQRRILVRLVLRHLDVEQFAAAELYARRLAAQADPDAPGMSRPLVALVSYRQARAARGRAGSDFAEAARRIFDELAPRPGDRTASLALAHLVRSEIADDLGDLDLARRELEAAPVEQIRSGAVLHVLSLRADALYRKLDDREALVAVLRRLAEHPRLAETDRLDHARAAVRAMVRGRQVDEAVRILEKERAGLPDGELAFALDLGLAVLAIRDDRPPRPVRAALTALYEAQVRKDRRRAVVLDAVQRAAELDADVVVEALSARYIADALPGSVERRGAVRLFQRTMQGRAYRRLARGRVDRALADLEAVAATGSTGGMVEALAMRARSGTPAAELSALPVAQGDGPPAHLARAFLLAQQIPELRGEAHRDAVERARAELRGPAWAELRSDPVAQAVSATLQHQRFLETGDTAPAQRAGVGYAVALDGLRFSPRLRAQVLGQLGMLHEQVGNWRMALAYHDERAKLPYLDDPAGLAVRLSRARVLLHVDRESQAAKVADEALAAVEGSPRLAEYRPLALDRAALCNLAASRFERAVALYDQLLAIANSQSWKAATLPLSTLQRGEGVGGRGWLVAHLARAAASTGAGAPARALEDLAEVERGLAKPELRRALRWPHATPEQVLRSYRLVVSGLRARAWSALGQAGEAAQALQERRALLAEQLRERNREEDARALALVDAQLTDATRSRGDTAAALRHAGEALASADAVIARTGAVDADMLDVLWLAADLRVAAGDATPPLDLSKRLERALDLTSGAREPAVRGLRPWFEAYLPLTVEESGQ